MRDVQVVIQVQNEYWNGTNNPKGMPVAVSLQDQTGMHVVLLMHCCAVEIGSAIRIGRYKLLVGACIIQQATPFIQISLSILCM